MRRGGWGVAAALLALAAAPPMALAQHESGDVVAIPSAPAPPSAPRRPTPEYGHAPVESEPLRELLWAPRVVLFPLHVLMELALRRTFGRAFVLVETEGYDTMLAAPSEGWTWGFSPHLRYDHGLAPSLGVRFGVIDPRETIRLSIGGAGWGTDRAEGRALATLGTRETQLRVRVTGSHREDRIHHGLGWGAPSDPRLVYTHDRFELRTTFSHSPWRRSRVAVGARARIDRFEPGAREGVPRFLAQTVFEEAPRFDEGAAPVLSWLHLVLDTRERRGARVGGHARSGVRVEATGGAGVDAQSGASWLRLETRGALVLEVLRDRILAVRGLADVVAPLGDGAVPFTEQVWLGGGLDRMAGFLPGRLIGSSAAALGLEWRYGLWPWLDARVFVDAGNVFAPGFEDFALERARLSFGAALTATDPRDFTILVAFGSDPIALGADVSQVRVALALGADGG